MFLKWSIASEWIIDSSSGMFFEAGHESAFLRISPIFPTQWHPTRGAAITGERFDVLFVANETMILSILSTGIFQ
jgi:hypothetical protein